MRCLFVHQNFPAQFLHIASALAANPANEIVAIGAQNARPLPNVALHHYTLGPQDLTRTHAFARRFDLECRRAEQVLYLATKILRDGFVPDVVVVHCGWGESLPFRAVFPNARIIVYSEFFYRAQGLDVNFDPEATPLSIDGVVALQARNACSLVALAECDIGVSPTRWQRSTFPVEFRSKIKVCHEGIDIARAMPDSSATVLLPNGIKLRRGDEVITFVCRNLEPLRGYHTFMRALPHVLRSRKSAQVVIVGGDEVSYGASAPAGQTWKSVFLDEVRERVDLGRIHFLGKIPYGEYLRVLQVSAAHVYLTYPFVLSWSLLEAMSVGCNVIASDTPPVLEALDERSGTLVGFFDHGTLASKIVEVLRDPDVLAPKRDRARRTVKMRYNRNVCLEAMARLMGAPEGALNS